MIAHRGRGAVRRRAPRHHRARHRAPPGLRAVGDGRAPVRLRGRAGHRRPGPAAARGAGRHRGGRSPTAAVDRRRRAARLACARPSSRRPTAFLDGLRTGAYNGHLEAGTRRAAGVARSATPPGIAPLDAYQAEYGKVGTPGVVRRRPHRGAHAGDRGADPARRRHQAPGQDGHRRHLPLRRDAAAAGRWWRPSSRPAPPRDRLSYRTLRTLADLDPAVAEVVGFTRYRDRRRPRGRRAPPSRSSTGAASPLDMPSRTDRDPVLRGTKHPVALEREVIVARGRSDGRTVVIVPETKDAAPPASPCSTSGSATTCRRRRPRRPAGLPRPVRGAARRGDRRPSRRSATTCSTTVPTADLLISPLAELADRWRTS